MTITPTTRAILKSRRALLAKGPLNWTDRELTEIAEFTAISHADLVTMRHKMKRASEFSIENVESLEALVVASEHPDRLRQRIERSISIDDARTKATTFTGLFPRIKNEIAHLDTELKQSRRSILQRRQPS